MIPKTYRALFGALVVSLFLWNMPYGFYALYPFKLLATWVHETCHGIAMLVTGAGFSHMEIFPDTSGLAHASRGVGLVGQAIIAAAGYMGTPAVGGMLLVAGQSRQNAKRVLCGIGILLFLSSLLFVTNDFGRIAIVATAGVCLVLAIASPPVVSLFVVNLFAAQACINAILDIRVLFRANLIVNGKAMGNSDAHNMAGATFGSPFVWASVWLAWSITLLILTFRALKQSTATTPNNDNHL